MLVPPQHPIERPALRALALLFFALGVAFTWLGQPAYEDWGWVGAAGALVSFGLFLVTVAVYMLGWLLREHELWREGRRPPQ